MAKNDVLELEGIINDVLPGNMFKVTVKNFPKPLMCYMGGRLKQNKIRVILGDEVKIEVSVYDLSRGRIVYRM